MASLTPSDGIPASSSEVDHSFGGREETSSAESPVPVDLPREEVPSAEMALVDGVVDGRLAAPSIIESAPGSGGPDGRTVLILCGLVASGKSTFAESLQEHFPRFVRCNQDDLGDRRRVEYLARQTLAQGNSVCIDRTNFNASQRWYWIKIAREFPGTQVWVIVFDTPYEVCAARVQTRTGHPTITSPELGLSVLSRFASDFQPPQPHEGYDRILYLKPTDRRDHPSPAYTHADIAAILQRVCEAEVPQPPPVTSHSTSHQGWPGPNNANTPRGFQGRSYYNGGSNRGWQQSRDAGRGGGFFGHPQHQQQRGGGGWWRGAGRPTRFEHDRRLPENDSGKRPHHQQQQSENGFGVGGDWRGRGQHRGSWRGHRGAPYGHSSGGVVNTQQPAVNGGYVIDPPAAIVDEARRRDVGDGHEGNEGPEGGENVRQ